MNARQLRLLARLMFEWELLRAIDWRDHNPDYRSISKNLESRVDRLLGFECAPVFSPGDDLYRAVLKSSRKRIIAENLHSAIVDAMGSPSFEHITSKIRKALDEEVTRLNRRLGIKALLARSDGFLAFLLLCGYYGARRILRNRSLLLRQFRDWREGCVRQRTFWKEYAASIGKIRRDARPVLMMIRVDWPQVGYSVGKIVTELQQAGTPVCCVVAEGLDPTRSPVLPHGWDWLREVEVMSLPQVPYPLWDALTGLFIPKVPRRYRAKGLRKFPSIPGIRSRFKRYSKEFALAANCTHFLIESVQPRSVLSMVGDKNIYGVAIGYCCVKKGIPIHSYTPVVLYPNGMEPTRLTPSILVASKLDIPAGESERSGRSYSVVGSPLFDDSVPLSTEATGNGYDLLRLVYFTKRVFPNFEVLSQIKRTLEQLDRKFHIIIKPHPTDTESDYQHLPSILQEYEYSYVRANEIESVDGCIARSDIVVSGPSNVIWSALRQRKPVIYLNFSNVGDDYYPQAYGRYAPVPFATAWGVAEVREKLTEILRLVDGGAVSIDGVKFQALMEDVFHGGGGSARRVAGLLMNSTGATEKRVALAAAR